MEQWFINQGVLGIIVLFVMVFLRKAFVRLFDEKSGLITRITDRHLVFIDSLARSQEDTTEAVEKLASLQKNTARAVSLHADALLALAGEVGEGARTAVAPHIEAIKLELN